MNTARSRDEEPKNETAPSKTRSSKSIVPQDILRHAGEVIPGLWVGDIRSVSYIEDLVWLSLRKRQPQQEQIHNVTVTVISVMSSSNLLKYVTDLLDEKQKHQMQLENEQKQNRFGVQCNVASSEMKGENRTASCLKMNSIDMDGIESVDNTPGTNSSTACLYPVKIHHIKVSLRDSMDADLMSVLDETLASIDEALGVSNNTLSKQNDSSISATSCTQDNIYRICLVHCAKGASRSVSVVIGYLLSRYSSEFTTFKAALDHVRKVRPLAMPNVRFAIDLRNYASKIHK